MMPGGIEDADAVVVEFFSRPVGPSGGPLERNAVIADHNIAESGTDFTNSLPVAGPELARLGFAVQRCGNDWSSDFTELRKCSDNRIHFAVLFERVQRLNEAVSNLLR